MSVALPQLPTKAEPPKAPAQSGTRTIKLSQLKAGETGRIVRVGMSDVGCRKRFAEMGLAEGMKVTVSGEGETMMLKLGSCKMGLACRCAEEITVIRI